jgi:DNA-binding NtrC family response regulator
MPRLLLIDDDLVAGRLVSAMFAPESVEVATAGTGADGLLAVKRFDPQVVVLDLRLPDVGGLDVLQKLQSERPSLPVVILTGQIDVKTAVRAMQLGAFHYLTKPIDRDELVLVVRRALERSALLSEVRSLRREVRPTAELARLMGPSTQIRRLIEQVEQVAPTDLTVLIFGETGTGKELVTQAIHRQSPRAAQPLIAVDCGAIPETLIESELFGHEKGAFTGAGERRRGRFHLAEGGTLFLDEAANLPLTLQPKLLRVLESREVHPVGGSKESAVDVRIIAATNVPLHSGSRAGQFREDLYYRLAQFPIRLPPLRERRDDIPHLVRRFVAEIGLELKSPIEEITADALERLAAHDWPGNARQLRNVVREAVVRSTGWRVGGALIASLLSGDAADLTPMTAPAALPSGASLRQIAERAAQSAERYAICAALRQAGGNKSAVAKRLHTDTKTLYTKIRRLAITVADYT